MNLWETIESFITSGTEGRKVDLKLEIDLSTRPARAEFAKDVSALANTPGGRGYLIFGVQDKKDRVSNNPADFVKGFRPSTIHAFEQQMVQALEYFCQPVPEVQFTEVVHPQVPNRPMGVVIVPRSYDRPYRIVEASGKVKAGCHIRRGSLTYPVDCASIGTGTPAVLINFGRKIETVHQERIEQLLEIPIEETIDIVYQLDDTIPHEPQIINLLRQAGLTEDEWASLPIVVNVHPFAPDTAAILACIHGLRGNFPNIVRMSRNSTTEKFEVVEVLHLQSLRNSARNKVAAQ